MTPNRMTSRMKQIGTYKIRVTQPERKHYNMQTPGGQVSCRAYEGTYISPTVYLMEAAWHPRVTYSVEISI